ncbi:hypothetical protein EYC80_004533 [Monilinia laxa]|uniref:F-box domain-containing protein n=1 Tax=Monilinia laxa TaxID=61186 RepID=A0A5N6KH18_MONLA|nr:hypothetical protein EYC80_004533 [Monilinia laxa]
MSSEADMQNYHLQQQWGGDADVEGTVISSLVERNFKATKADGTLAKAPYEIVEKIMNELDPVSQLCFSLTTSRFYKMIKTSKSPESYQIYLYDYNYAGRLSLDLSTQMSTCGKHIWDKDDAYLNHVPTFQDAEVQWQPRLVDLLWNEPFFWGSGGQWCEGCCRILPPTSWNKCEFERRFWETALPRHNVITNFLVNVLFEKIKGDETREDPNLLLKWLIDSDTLRVYESQQSDFNYKLCVKCRLRDVITDSGRRPQVWQGFWEGYENTGRVADAVSVDGGLGHKNRRYEVLCGEEWSDSWRRAVSWKDVWRACGLFVKEYKRASLPALGGASEPQTDGPSSSGEEDTQMTDW